MINLKRERLLKCDKVLYCLNFLVKLAYFLVSFSDFKEGANLHTQYPVDCLTETEPEIPHQRCENDPTSVTSSLFSGEISNEALKVSI